jgi:coatomer subunit zeta
MAPNMYLHSVQAVLLLATDTPAESARIFAKYYTSPHTSATNPPPPQPYSTVKEQKAFEKGLLEKTSKQTSDVILYDNKVVVFKMESDIMIYVVGSAEENEILLYNVILSLRDTLSVLFKYVSSNVDKGCWSRRPTYIEVVL